MYTVDIITSFSDFMALREEWNRLVEASDAEKPLSSHEWFTAWWKSYGSGNEMLVLRVRDGQDTAAIVPLMRTRLRWRGVPLRTISFMANCHSLRNSMILARDDGRAIGETVVDALRRQGAGHDLMLFDYVLRDTRTDRLLRETIDGRNLKFAALPSDTSPFLTVDGGWEAFLKTRSRKFREKLRHMVKVFERTGASETVTYIGGDLLRAMSELLHVSVRTWKFQARTAIASSPQDTVFYYLLAHAAAGRSWLNLKVLFLSGKPVAFMYMLTGDGKMYILKSGFDEEYRKMAPSEYLTLQAIRECFTNGVREVDMLGKAAPFKANWSSGLRQHTKYMVFNDTALGTLVYLLRAKVTPWVSPLFAQTVKRSAGPRQAALLNES